MKLRLLFLLIFGSFLTTGFSQSIGIIGDATPTGWAADTDMVQDVDSSHLWSIVIQLTEGGFVKFRQDDAWTINWGNDDFPVGIGEPSGADIPVSVSGEYTVTFNSQTGAYHFSLPSDIGIIGSATPTGWDSDINMFQDAVDTNKYTITLRLVAGAAKFRANDAWTVNWGATDFPSGVGTPGGMDIPIPFAGKYDITFDKSTGAYSFDEIAEYTRIGLVGSANPGGWDGDTYLTRSTSNPDEWTTDVSLTDGVVKFRADSAWTLNWGGSDFPVGVAVLNGPEIPVDSSDYRVTFNTLTLEYEFLPIIPYETIGIIGDATPGGFNEDTDMMQDPLDPSIWRLRIILTDGDLQFRANNAWDMFWSSGEFPSGTGVFEGAPIPVLAGEYKITFNSITGEYSFEELIVFGTVGIIGTVFPVTMWDEDVDMVKDLEDEAVWYLNSVELATGEAKFRAENDWIINWGSPAFPTGIGTQNGMNIIVPGGTYRVVINTATGEYSFGDPSSSTTNLLSSNSISIAPNPAKDVLNITVTAQEMKGDVQVTLFNQQGQKVLTSNLNIQDRATLQVGSVQPGVYTLHMTNGKSIVGKKVVIVK